MNSILSIHQKTYAHVEPTWRELDDIQRLGAYLNGDNMLSVVRAESNESSNRCPDDQPTT